MRRVTDVLLMLKVIVDYLPERKYLGRAVDQRQHVHAEGLLQLSMLVQLVEHYIGVNVAAHLDHDAHTGAVGLVADVGYALDALFVHQFGNLFDKARFVDHVGDFADHNAALALRHGLDLAARAGDDLAAAGGVGLVYACLAHDYAAGGEVGALDKLHQLLGRGIGMVEHVYATASMASPRLCGGMLVAMPTAMPAEPLTKRFGKREGITEGCISVSSKLG